MKYIFSIVLLLVLIVFLVVSFTLIRNQAHLLTKPGMVKRLKVYLTQNTAHTSMQPSFPELHSGVFDTGASTLFAVTQSSLTGLGWSFSIVDKDRQAGDYRIHAIVVSPLFKFKDDVMVLVYNQHCSHGMLQSVLDVSSSSRVGKADFAANADHIQRLLHAVRAKLDQIPLRRTQPASCR